ncbi:uncharacterized protein NEMAJ01_2236 [Nematocida major]|uniref:uncharacterized protein n=1 Tax=Nematocida major TaxID=1912982 RepID=UPI002007B803|nr:uncharacterized protein NEMAJ01_2236 [Nematocida major]KAH9387340.1 hypothetical protein NEMAJ01_2236 [Nematocida major]
MRLKEVKVSMLVVFVSTATAIRMAVVRKSVPCGGMHIFIPTAVSLLHVMPFLLSFFVSIPVKFRRLLNSAIYLLSSAAYIAMFSLFAYTSVLVSFNTVFILACMCTSLLESFLCLCKWHIRSKKRREFRNRPLVRRKYSTGEIKMPPISVSTETKHLRAKADFVYNGAVYIRKGETVELLKPIGSYYSVRTSVGTEYIVPKEVFF